MFHFAQWLNKDIANIESGFSAVARFSVFIFLRPRPMRVCRPGEFFCRLQMWTSFLAVQK